MSAVLVMTPAPGAWPDWFGAALRECALVSEHPGSPCSAVLVVNDYSAEALELLRGALELRATRPSLPVAVLTPLDDDGALARLVREWKGQPASPWLPTSEAFAAIGAGPLPSRIGISADAVTFEYDA
ncbi:MAG TPA: hypothetical protein VM074_08460 [Solimonas sp.]|nr:hypothetical protein [Solimonas sp.]